MRSTVGIESGTRLSVAPAEAVLRFVRVAALEAAAGVGPPPASVEASGRHLKEGARESMRFSPTTPLSWSSGGGEPATAPTTILPAFRSVLRFSILRIALHFQLFAREGYFCKYGNLNESGPVRSPIGDG
ncbi:hypothetical protein Acr_20g0001280 [Actinidia rufa]|uniref:Uncharacterized protein n=1 Tax=Actinidia rufa TaxID=165716 RepID=A0A7J0GC09_9ERIC|nr:hypothetical protein Acr_20g0001280 [Actinidia rufa]